MSVTIATGIKSLISVGLGISDVAFLYDRGKKFGNWLRLTTNDEDFFTSIQEDYSALLKRRGLVEISRMEQLWSGSLQFVYQGRTYDRTSQTQVKDDQKLTPFSWLMVTLIAALDICLPASEIRALLVQVFLKILGGDRETEVSLRLPLNTSIESWRSMGCVRGMVVPISDTVRKRRFILVKENAIPQMNRAERNEMTEFLVWLLAGDQNDFVAISATVYAIGDALAKAGVHLKAGDERQFEGQLLVHYAVSQDGLRGLKNMASFRSPTSRIPPQQNTFPCLEPQQMIDGISVPHSMRNYMQLRWIKGVEVAKLISMTALAKFPATFESCVNYTLSYDPCTTRFDGKLFILSRRHFPVDSQSLILALDDMLNKHRDYDWLCRITSSDNDDIGFSSVHISDEHLLLLLEYQAFVSGYYYQLLAPFVSFEFAERGSYLCGVWGFRDNFFLNMCSKFANSYQRTTSINRTFILRMLGTMYAGRQTHSPNAPSEGLVAIIDRISILSMSLLRASDDPKEIAKFAVVTLPILDLHQEGDGELFGGKSSGIEYRIGARSEISRVSARSPTGEWSVHAKMGILTGEGQNGVVMTARCSGIYVGAFSPVMADVTLIGAYRPPTRADRQVVAEESKVNAFEVSEADFRSGYIARPVSPGDVTVVQSRHCPAMRYTAAGLYGTWKVAVATDDLEAAVEAFGDDPGIVIT